MPVFSWHVTCLLKDRAPSQFGKTCRIGLLADLSKHSTNLQGHLQPLHQKSLDRRRSGTKYIKSILDLILNFRKLNKRKLFCRFSFDLIFSDLRNMCVNMPHDLTIQCSRFPRLPQESQIKFCALSINSTILLINLFLTAQ